MVLESTRHRQAQAWEKISIKVNPDMTEAVAAYLSELTGVGLEIAAAENSPAGPGTISTEKITAYILIDPHRSDQHDINKKREEIRDFLLRLQHIFPQCSVPVVESETIIEEDWGKKWKSFFTAFHITPTLVIKPSWEEFGEQDKKRETRACVIEMDPGLAFGTGHHASTQLALQLLEEIFQHNEKKPENVLDVGTGSGILAMACGVFGARKILAVDNDPDAVDAAKQNIARNHLEDRISAGNQDVASLNTGFDIVVANITHDILSELAGTLTRLLDHNAFLILSGIMQGEQERSIRGIYAELGLEFIKNLARDEWTALKFQKK